MVKRYWSLLFCLFSLGLFAENPLGMPEYSQILEVSFNTVEEAQKAELEKTENRDKTGSRLCASHFLQGYLSRIIGAVSRGIRIFSGAVETRGKSGAPTRNRISSWT